MAAITSTSTAILGKDKDPVNYGGCWNVRSGHWERKIDFAALKLTAGTEYEFLVLPKHFVPRNLAIVNIDDSGVTVTATCKSDSSKTVACASGAECAIASIAGASSDGEVICLKIGAATEKGCVKVVVSGDRMTGEWDSALSGGGFDPASEVEHNLQPEPAA